MSRLARFLSQDVNDPRINAEIGVLRNPDLPCNTVGGQKPDPYDIADKAIGIFPDGFDGAIAVCSANFQAEFHRNFVFLQKQDGIADPDGFAIRRGDRGGAALADPFDFGKPLGCVFDDVQRPRTEALDNGAGFDFSDAAEQPSRQKMLDRRYVCRRVEHGFGHLELLAVLGIGFEVAHQRQGFALRQSGKNADGSQIPALGIEVEYGISRIGIVKNDVQDDPFDDHYSSCLSSSARSVRSQLNPSRPK